MNATSDIKELKRRLVEADRKTKEGRSEAHKIKREIKRLEKLKQFGDLIAFNVEIRPEYKASIEAAAKKKSLFKYQYVDLILSTWFRTEGRADLVRT